MWQSKQKHYYDRGTKPLKPVAVGDDVRVRLGRQRDNVVMTGTHNTPRSYYDTTENGQLYRRNRSIVKPSLNAAYIVPGTVSMSETELSHETRRDGNNPSQPDLEPPDVSSSQARQRCCVAVLDATNLSGSSRTKWCELDKAYCYLMWDNLLVSEINTNDFFILVPINMMSHYEIFFSY